jgi:hypothetical protein
MRRLTDDDADFVADLRRVLGAMSHGFWHNREMSFASAIDPEFGDRFKSVYFHYSYLDEGNERRKENERSIVLTIQWTERNGPPDRDRMADIIEKHVVEELEDVAGAHTWAAVQFLKELPEEVRGELLEPFHVSLDPVDPEVADRIERHMRHEARKLAGMAAVFGTGAGEAARMVLEAAAEDVCREVTGS